MATNEDVNGKVEIIDGVTYWMGTVVNKCSLCGIAPTNVDDCGWFGNPLCPCYGVGLCECGVIHDFEETDSNYCSACGGAIN